MKRVNYYYLILVLITPQSGIFIIIKADLYIIICINNFSMYNNLFENVYNRFIAVSQNEIKISYL